MNKIIIIGKDSYIGTRFAAYAGERFSITTTNARDGNWQAVDLSLFDTVLCVVGIAHEKQKKEAKALYYRVNCDLPAEIAKKAKSCGVKQFIFISSMAVYGKARGEILSDTPPTPIDFYGGSKLKAERALQELASADFRVCIVRPPMVYGPGCKGNFPKLVRLAKAVPFFPHINNRRSMLYIDNLCEFFCLAVKENYGGVHLPQNSEYVNTTELVQRIAAWHGKRLYTTRFFNPLVHLLARLVPSANKLFATLIYQKNGQEHTYNVVDFRESVKLSCINM
jgi:UDP-glucose 4-epimerase